MLVEVLCVTGEELLMLLAMSQPIPRKGNHGEYDFSRFYLDNRREVLAYMDGLASGRKFKSLLSGLNAQGLSEDAAQQFDRYMTERHNWSHRNDDTDGSVHLDSWLFNDGDLRFCRFANSNLPCAQLQGTDFEGAYLPNTNLDDAVMTRCYLGHADMQGCFLRNVRLDEAVLEQASLKDADLEGANLHSASFVGADLTGAKLNGADLMEANLEGACLENAVLRGAKLAWAILPDGYCSGGQKSQEEHLRSLHIPGLVL